MDKGDFLEEQKVVGKKQRDEGRRNGRNRNGSSLFLFKFAKQSIVYSQWFLFK